MDEDSIINPLDAMPSCDKHTIYDLWKFLADLDDEYESGYYIPDDMKETIKNWNKEND